MADSAGAPSSTDRRAIVLVVDRLSAGFLSPYGNTWVETSAFNRVSANGLLFEHPVASSGQIEQLYQAMFAGHEFPTVARSNSPLLPRLTEAGVTSRLLTDAPELAEFDLCRSFGSAEVLPQLDYDSPALRSGDTELARFFAAAVAAIAEQQTGLVWLHSRGMTGAWDAPLHLRNQFRDEEDPDPPSDVFAPQGSVPEPVDPDLLQGWGWAYAGQILLLDQMLGHLIDLWMSQPEPTLLIVLGARGAELGEHGVWCAGRDRVATLPYSQLTHVPLLMATNPATPDAVISDRSLRSQALVQHDQLYHTLVDWFGVGANDEVAESLLDLPQRELAVDFQGARELAVCCDAAGWQLRTRKWAAMYGKQSERCKLYLKPDDRWDFNDVADRCPDIVTAFDGILGKLQSGDPIDRIRDLYPIDPVLLTAPE